MREIRSWEELSKSEKRLVLLELASIFSISSDTAAADFYDSGKIRIFKEKNMTIIKGLLDDGEMVELSREIHEFK